MFDGQARKLIDPVLNAVGKSLADRGITANQVTIAACVIGLAAAAAIISQAFLIGLVLLLISRLGDGLDGAVAKHTKPTDFGGFLDIVLDFLFYGAIPFAFIAANPAENAVAGGFLILSFYVNGSSFLAYAIMAEKQKMQSTERGAKSLYFTTGLAEATETIGVFVLFCLFPGYFAEIAWVFAAVCFYTAFSRIMLARQIFTDDQVG